MVLGSEQIKMIVMVIGIALLTVILATVLNALLKRTFRKPHAAIERRAKALSSKFRGLNHETVMARLSQDKTRLVFIRRFIVGSIYLIGAIFIISSIPELRNLSYSLLAGAGVAAIIVGFATQKTIANLIAGMMIAISQPFRIGDRIKFKDEFGSVEDITFRHTVIKTWDNRHLIIPNALINEDTVENYSFDDEKILATVEFQVSYESDFDAARKIIIDEISKHRLFRDIKSESDIMAKDDSIKVRMTSLNDSGVSLRAYYWAPSQASAWTTSCDVRESVLLRLRKAKIHVPYPHRTVIMKR